MSLANKSIQMSLGLAAANLISSAASAAIVSSDFLYEANGKTYEGYVSYPEGKTGLTPVLLHHDWHGVGPLTKDIAQRFAKAGYFAFAVDLFGQGVRPESSEDAAKNAATYLTNRELMRQRLIEAYAQLEKFKQVDAREVFSLGYSFGGPVAIELSQLDLPVTKTAILWGALNAPQIELGPDTKSSFLLLQGLKDPFAQPQDMAALEQKFVAHGIRHKIVTYENGYHAFGHTYVGDLSAYGIKYDEQIAEDAWSQVFEFFKAN